MKAQLSSLREDGFPRQFQAVMYKEYFFSEAFARHKNTEISYLTTRNAQFAVNLQRESPNSSSTLQHS